MVGLELHDYQRAPPAADDDNKANGSSANADPASGGGGVGAGAGRPEKKSAADVMARKAAAFAKSKAETALQEAAQVAAS